MCLPRNNLGHLVMKFAICPKYSGTQIIARDSHSNRLTSEDTEYHFSVYEVSTSNFKPSLLHLWIYIHSRIHIHSRINFLIRQCIFMYTRVYIYLVFDIYTLWYTHSRIHIFDIFIHSSIHFFFDIFTDSRIHILVYKFSTYLHTRVYIFFPPTYLHTLVYIFAHIYTCHMQTMTPSYVGHDSSK